MQEATYEKKSITLEMAKKMIEGAEKKAKEIGMPMVTAICDESGNLKALSRMDGAALIAIQIAQDKAYTAISFGLTTDEWYSFIKDDPPLLTGIPHVSRMIVFGGGYPIKIGDEIIGGIGVSGGQYPQDMECAKAGLEVLK